MPKGQDHRLLFTNMGLDWRSQQQVRCGILSDRKIETIPIENLRRITSYKVYGFTLLDKIQISPQKGC